MNSSSFDPRYPRNPWFFIQARILEDQAASQLHRLSSNALPRRSEEAKFREVRLIILRAPSRLRSFAVNLYQHATDSPASFKYG